MRLHWKRFSHVGVANHCSESVNEISTYIDISVRLHNELLSGRRLFSSSSIWNYTVYMHKRLKHLGLVLVRYCDKSKILVSVYTKCTGEVMKSVNGTIYLDISIECWLEEIVK